MCFDTFQVHIEIAAASMLVQLHRVFLSIHLEQDHYKNGQAAEPIYCHWLCQHLQSTGALCSSSGNPQESI